MVELCERFSTEWLGYLTGECSKESGEARIDGLYFPAQVAGPASVRNISELIELKPRTIGAIHSHVRMQAHWSSTDCDHANWPLEIVLNAAGEYKANLLVALKCGNTMRKDAKVVLTQGRVVEGFESLLKGALAVGDAHEKAKQPAAAIVPYAYGHFSRTEGYVPPNGNGQTRWADARTGHELCPICYEPTPCTKHPVVGAERRDDESDAELLWGS